MQIIIANITVYKLHAEKLSRGGGGGAKALKNIMNHTAELEC